MRKPWLIALPLVALALPGVVQGDDPTCRPEAPRLSRDEYLRALSLDLRGVIPSMEEYESVASMDEVPASIVDAWIASPEHAERVVRHHRALLWPNVSNVRFVDFRRRVGTTGTGDATRWFRSSQTTTVAIRGANVPCDDVPATFDADGNVRFRTEVQPDGRTARIEGWVEVEPYWAPGTTIHVCAFDAQTRALSAGGRACNTRDGSADPDCGCGDNLRWCGVDALQNQLVSAFAEDVERRIAASIRADEPYTAIFTSRRAYVNGPIVFYYRNLTRVYDSVPLEPLPIDVANLPELDYGDADTWVEIELPEAHAGILTSPLYLLRFQTNRARANRFYDAFLCQPFQPPTGGLPVADEVETRQADLQLRAGCRYCHAILEPAASHWGRWTTQGAGFLAPDSFPVFAPECAECARGEETCSAMCSSYVTRALSPAEEPFLGMLRAYEFLRPEHEVNVEEGPLALVRDGLADGRFTECAVRTTTSWLLGRPLESEEEAWSRELASTFVGSELRFSDMERAIVTHETYRRVR